MRLPPELIASLESGELAAYQVAADWLIAHGEPWGELINAQCRLEGATDPSVFMTFKKQADALLKQHGAKWVGAPASVSWRRGFVEWVELEDLSALPAVLASDVAGLMTTLSLHGSPTELRRALELLIVTRPLRMRALCLQNDSLSLQGAEGRGEGKSLRLQRLELYDLAPDLPIDWAMLRELTLADTTAPPLTALPSTLRRLELLDCDVGVPALAALVDRQAALRVLHMEEDLPDDVARWLADSPAVARLEHLALGGPFTDDGLDAILKRAARFSRLHSIVLYGGRFGPTIRKWAYKQLPQLTIERTRPGPGWPGHPRHGVRFTPRAGRPSLRDRP